MQNVRVIQLLSTFKKEEFQELEKFLEVSFLSSSRNLKPLFAIVKKYYSDFENKDFTLQNIYRELFGKKKFSEKYLTAMFSDLYKTVKNFLVVKEALSNTALYNDIVVGEFLKRQLDVEFERHLRNAEKFLDDSPVFDFYFRHKRDLMVSHTAYLADKKDYDTYKDSYQKTMEYMSLEILIILLKNYPEYLLYERKDILRDKSNAFGLFFNLNLKEIIENIREISDKERIALKIYYLIAILDRNNSIDLYYEVKKLTIDNYNYFGRIEKRYIYMRLINFLNILFTEGNYKLNPEMFELNNIYIQDKEQIYLQDGYFNKRNFRNIVICALFEGKYEWAINFINDYKKYLKEEEGDNLVNHNLALTYFRMKDFDKSLEVLSRVKFNFGTFKEEISLLKAIVLYEKGLYHESLENVQAFKRTFKKTSVMTQSTYLLFKNSITFLIKFLKIILKQKYSELDFLEQQLNECQIISVKPWLLGKISELKKLNNIY